jgi:1D-myo-inositol-tetrakisphosphate 5-kinase/inositol-polyphosphate multikinase
MLLHEDGFVLKPAQAPPKGTREVEFYESVSRSCHPLDTKLYSLIPKFYGTERLSLDELPHSQYLVLEDLTQGMVAPCVMDVKIGAKTYGPMASAAKIAQEDAKYLGTKKPLGFSVLGIINRSGEGASMKRYDKSFGMNLKTDSVQKILQVFFNSQAENPQIIGKLVAEFSSLLADVQQFFAEQTRYHIYASSLLLVYDHQG